MELRTITSVRFISDPHSYIREDGVELMGVTTLLRKHGLATDYSGVKAETLNAAAKRGTKVHELIEDFENGMPVWQNADLRAYQELGLKVLASEYLVTDGMTVASKIDQVLDTELDGDFVDLADIKTCAKVDREYVSWQLSVYAYLFELQNPGIKVSKLYCLHIRDGKAKKIAVMRKADCEVARLIECEREGDLFFPDMNPTPAQSAQLTIFREIRETFQRIEEAKQFVKETEAKIKSLYDTVGIFMQQEGLSEMAIPGGRLVRTADYERTTVDSKKLKEDYPEVAALCEKRTLVKGTVSFKPEK